MSAATMTRSAFPPVVLELLPRAQDIADQVGGVPSLNRLKAELRIGTVKARLVRDAVRQLREADAEPAEVDTDPDTTEPTPSPVEGTPGPVPGPVPATVPDEAVTGAADDALVLASPLPSTPAHEAADEPDTRPATSRSVARRPVARRHRVAIRVHQPHPSSTPSTPEPVVPEAAPAVPEPAAPAPIVAAVPAGVRGRKPTPSWPVLLLALPAFVAIWSGWVGLGELAGFGIVHPLPGIWDSAQINTAITLPIGVETYAAYALHVWLSSGAASRQARGFAKWSAIGSLLLGMAGQGAYHLMTADGMTRAPWLIVTAVSCLPVAVLGMGAALAHLIRRTDEEAEGGVSRA